MAIGVDTLVGWTIETGDDVGARTGVGFAVGVLDVTGAVTGVSISSSAHRAMK
jgi:hypothetical protein